VNAAETRELEASIEQMYEIARGFGLDFYTMRFELVPADVLYTFGAYAGMPTRFSHWSFGKAYHRMKLDYDFGLSRIYELVINSDPCYAFLLDSNSLVQNKLVSAHVLAHCDFFKNNALFAFTQRNVVDSMAASAERFRGYELEHGRMAVEEFLDAALAIQEHIDPSRTGRRKLLTDTRDRDGYGAVSGFDTRGRKVGPRLHGTSSSSPVGPYDDLFDLDRRLSGGGHDPSAAKGAAAPGVEPSASARMEKDLLLFLIHHSPVMTEWQRDILTVIREEMLYFWPQIETKIMNEGWATYRKDGAV